MDHEYVSDGPFKPENGGASHEGPLGARQSTHGDLCRQRQHRAGGVLAEARRQNVRIPEEMSLVGFDGTHQAEESVPPLTSVSQPLQEMGRSALSFILRQKNGEEIDSRRVELATHLVVRESTAPPRASNARAAAAVED